MSQEPVQTPWVERRPQQKQLGGRGSEWSRGDEEGLAEGPGTGGVAGPALQLHHQAAAGGGGAGRARGCHPERAEARGSPGSEPRAPKFGSGGPMYGLHLHVPSSSLCFFLVKTVVSVS